VREQREKGNVLTKGAADIRVSFGEEPCDETTAALTRDTARTQILDAANV
jgi:hypothetical protein